MEMPDSIVQSSCINTTFINAVVFSFLLDCAREATVCCIGLHEMSGVKFFSFRCGIDLQM